MREAGIVAHGGQGQPVEDRDLGAERLAEPARVAGRSLDPHQLAERLDVVGCVLEHRPEGPGSGVDVVLFEERAAEDPAGVEVGGFDGQGVVAGLAGLDRLRELQVGHPDSGVHVRIVDRAVGDPEAHGPLARGARHVGLLLEVLPEVQDGVLVLPHPVGDEPQVVLRGAAGLVDVEEAQEQAVGVCHPLHPQAAHAQVVHEAGCQGLGGSELQRPHDVELAALQHAGGAAQLGGALLQQASQLGVDLPGLGRDPARRLELAHGFVAGALGAVQQAARVVDVGAFWCGSERVVEVARRHVHPAQLGEGRSGEHQRRRIARIVLEHPP